MSINPRCALPLVFAGLMLSVTGCQSAGRQDSDHDDAPPAKSAPLAERVADYWKYRQADEPAPLFDFLTPDRRSGSTAEDYAAWYRENEPFVIQSYEIGEIARQQRFAWAEVTYSTKLRKFPNLPPRKSQMWQKWVEIDGAWYPAPPSEQKLIPAAPAQRDAAAEQRLRQAFEQAWQFRAASNWAGLYQVTDPNDHDQISEDEFVRVHEALSVRYLDYRIEWVEVAQAADRGRVRVTFTTTLTDPTVSKIGDKTQSVEEQWVEVDGNWFLDIAG